MNEDRKLFIKHSKSISQLLGALFIKIDFFILLFFSLERQIFISIFDSCLCSRHWFMCEIIGSGLFFLILEFNRKNSIMYETALINRNTNHLLRAEKWRWERRRNLIKICVDPFYAVLVICAYFALFIVW